MDLFKQLINKQIKMSVVGLGYVGLPLAITFSEKIDVIGFDVNTNKINNYLKGIDSTNEIGTERLLCTKVEFTSNEIKLKNAMFHIIAVPTPISRDKKPDLKHIISASEILGRNLNTGSIVVYESTVYPGVTEEICVPVLEKASGLVCGIDFKVGYSPERINPGDKEHTIKSIIKVVSGMDEEALNIIANVYSIIVEAGVFRTSSIKVAEAAKVIENSQRDLNIAFMNELSIIFNKIGIDTIEVLNAASTKWNFLNFYPGLVGGHCIGVDPYYLTYKAEEIGYHPQVILAGRRINDDMSKYIVDNTIKALIKADKKVKGSKVLIMGITFKENVPDVRNSKVANIVSQLKEYEIEVVVSDPIAYKSEVQAEYNIVLEEYKDVIGIDAIIMAVSHDEFKKISLKELIKKFNNDKYILIDVKGMYNKEIANREKFLYWRL